MSPFFEKGTYKGCAQVLWFSTKIEQWSNIWQMDFNVKKRPIMQCSNSARKQKFDYNSENWFTPSISRVELSDNLKFNNHINAITKKASNPLSF